MKTLSPIPTAEEMRSRDAGRLPIRNISESLTCWVTCSQLPGFSISRLVSLSGSPFSRRTVSPAKMLRTPVYRISCQTGDMSLSKMPPGVSCHFGMGHWPLLRTLSWLTSKILRLPPRPGCAHLDPFERHFRMAFTTRRDSCFSAAAVALLRGYPRARNASRASRAGAHLLQQGFSLDTRSQALWSAFEDTVGPLRRGICIRKCNVEFSKYKKKP